MVRGSSADHESCDMVDRAVALVAMALIAAGTGGGIVFGVIMLMLSAIFGIALARAIESRRGRHRRELNPTEHRMMLAPAPEHRDPGTISWWEPGASLPELPPEPEAEAYELEAPVTDMVTTNDLTTIMTGAGAMFTVYSITLALKEWSPAPVVFVYHNTTSVSRHYKGETLSAARAHFAATSAPLKIVQCGPGTSRKCRNSKPTPDDSIHVNDASRAEFEHSASLALARLKARLSENTP